jgi:hypothetical protein
VAAPATHPVSRYVPLLIEGDLRGLLDLFADAPRINDPWLGWIEEAMLELFVATSSKGLIERRARVEHVATTATPLGAVEECIVTLVRRGETVRLPVAIAGAGSVGALTSLHVYHSMRPLTGAHAVRRPILPAKPGLRLPLIVERLHEGIAAADVRGVLRQFDVRGLLREAESERHVIRGADELELFFGRLLARGGISAERCTLTDDGSSCALEYNLIEWDELHVPHQAGLAVYERSPAGLLAAVRLYDDIERPAWVRGPA